MYDDIAVIRETIKIELKGSMLESNIVNAKYAIVNKNIFKYILLLLYLEFTMDNPIANCVLTKEKRAINTEKANSCALFLFFKDNIQ